MSDSLFEFSFKPGEELVFKVRPWSVPEAMKETASHVKAANREALLALRSLLDQAIEALEEKPESSQTKKKIQVE